MKMDEWVSYRTLTQVTFLCLLGIVLYFTIKEKSVFSCSLVRCRQRAYLGRFEILRQEGRAVTSLNNPENTQNPNISMSCDSS